MRIRKVTEMLEECEPAPVGQRRQRGEITRFGVQLRKWLRGKPNTWLVEQTRYNPPEQRIDATNLTHWSYAQPTRKEPTVFREREPSVYAVATVARALGLTVDAFLFGDPGDTIHLDVTEQEAGVIFAYRDKRRREFKAKVDQLLRERETP